MIKRMDGSIDEDDGLIGLLANESDDMTVVLSSSEEAKDLDDIVMVLSRTTFLTNNGVGEGCIN